MRQVASVNKAVLAFINKSLLPFICVDYQKFVNSYAEAVDKIISNIPVCHQRTNSI